MSLFFDPTPRIELADSLCVVESLSGASSSHAGISGVVGFCGKSYAATIAGDPFEGCRARFIQTKTGSVWAIPEFHGGYRSAFPRLPNAWARRAPVSLALAQILKKNRKLRVYRQGKIVSAVDSTATLLIDGTEFTMPSPTPVLPEDIGKQGLAYIESGAMSLVYFADGYLFSSWNAGSTDGGIIFGDLYAGDAGNRGIRITRKPGAPAISGIKTGFAVDVVAEYDPVVAADAVISSIVANLALDVSLISRDTEAWWSFGTHVSNIILIKFTRVSQPSAIEITMPQSHYCRFTRSGDPTENDYFKVEGFNVSSFKPSLYIY